MENRIQDEEESLTKQEVLDELELETFAQSDVGEVDALSELSSPDHCFGRKYTPDSACLEECNARGVFRGEIVKLNELCRRICAGKAGIHDRAAGYYRPGSGSYYVVKALLDLGEGTREGITARAAQLAKMDGKSIGNMADRTDRTLTDMKSKGKVRKAGRGREAMYAMEGGHDEQD